MDRNRCRHRPERLPGFAGIRTFGEAACLFLRGNPEGQAYHERLVKEHGRSKALSILAQKLGRAVYVMLKRRETFDMQRFLKG